MGSKNTALKKIQSGIDEMDCCFCPTCGRELLFVGQLPAEDQHWGKKIADDRKENLKWIKKNRPDLILKK